MSLWESITMEDTRKILAYGILPAFSAIGFYGSMYLAFENGLIKSLNEIVRGKATALPNTKATVIRRWTGIKPIDDYLTFYLAFFVPIVGKSNPSTTLQNRYFIGQFAALWALTQLQGQKASNSPLILSRLTIVLTAFGIQTVGAATIIPLFCAAQLATSTLSKAGLAAASGVLSEARTSTIPLGTTLSILIPLITASFVRSRPVQQTFLNIFQLFYIVTELLEAYSPSLAPAAVAGPLSMSLARVYSFAEYLSIASHVGIISIIFLTKVVPNLFPKGFAEHVTFKRVFLPRIKLETHGDTFEARIHFLRWDAAISLSSLLLWATYCYAAVLPASSLSVEGLGKMGLEVIARALLTGPVGAAAHLLRQRDIIASV